MTDKMNKVACPECGSQMHKAGFVFSGRTKRQRWCCPKCGRHTIVPNSSIIVYEEAKNGKRS